MCCLGPVKLLLPSSSFRLKLNVRPKQTINISPRVCFSLSQIMCCEFDLELLPRREEKMQGFAYSGESKARTK